MSIPFLDLQRQYAAIGPQIEAAVLSALRSQRFILGPEVETLERAMAAVCATRHGVGVASGTDALILALEALGVGPGDSVVTTPFSFFATASSIARLGARPVFADIDPVTFNLDPVSVSMHAPKGARALMPVHLFGQCADVETLIEAARAAGAVRIKVVEDAAQAIGAKRHGAPAGSLGDAGALSFYPTKNLGGAGDAGMVVTNDDDTALRVRRLRAHGDVGRYDHRDMGMNSRLDTLQAAVLLVKAGYLERWNDARRARAAFYDELLSDAGGDLVLPATQKGNLHTYHQYVIRTKSRDSLARHLGERGIGCAVYYPIPLHLQACFSSLAHRAGDFPAAEAACREVLALPLYPELAESEQTQVAEAIRSFFRSV